jgi:hypothetical protein
MKAISNNIATLILAGAIVVASLAYVIKPTLPAFGAAFTGQAAFVQIATSTTVTANTNTRIFTSNETCKSRVISTQGSAAMLIFADNTTNYLSSTTLAGNVGHIQAASTTVAYDSGLFGCGAVYARTYSTSILTHSEF